MGVFAVFDHSTASFYAVINIENDPDGGGDEDGLDVDSCGRGRLPRGGWSRCFQTGR